MKQLLIEVARPILRLLILTPYKMWADFHYRYRNNPELAPSIKKMQEHVKELERMLK